MFLVELFLDSNTIRWRHNLQISVFIKKHFALVFEAFGWHFLCFKPISLSLCDGIILAYVVRICILIAFDIPRYPTNKGGFLQNGEMLYHKTNRITSTMLRSVIKYLRSYEITHSSAACGSLHFFRALVTSCVLFYLLHDNLLGNNCEHLISSFI